MKIATWNINGIKARIDAAQTWLKSASPDIACLQEIKCADEAFPSLEFEALGYNVAVHGQKGFNGVALLSKLPFDEITPRLAGDPDDVQARYLEAWCRCRQACSASSTSICRTATAVPRNMSTSSPG